MWEEKAELIINSDQDVNLSNWQITNIINQLTTINNKFDILSKLGEKINNNNMENIFIIDKSFNFNTNYRTYFKANSVLDAKKLDDLQNLFYMGRVVPMYINDNIDQINKLFDFYRKISDIYYTYTKRRLKTVHLVYSFEAIEKGEYEQAFKGLFDNACEIIRDRIGDDKKLTESIKKVESVYKKINTDIDTKEIGYNNNFEKNFLERSRPIVGIYDKQNSRFDIINFDHMLDYGELSEAQIKLKSITKNSPIEMVFGVTAIPVAVFSYLAYREKQVNEDEETSTGDDSLDKSCDNFTTELDVPKTRTEIYGNYISNNNKQKEDNSGLNNVINLSDIILDKAQKMNQNLKISINVKKDKEHND